MIHSINTFYQVYPEAQEFQDFLFPVFADQNCSVPVTTIREMLLQEIQKGKKIVFDASGETILPGLYNWIHDIIDDMNVDDECFFILCGALDANQVYQNYRIRENKVKNPVLISFSFFEKLSASNLQHKQFPVSYTPGLKPKKFLCFNKIERYHRLYLYAHAMKHGWFSNSYFSFQGSHPDFLDNKIQEDSLNLHPKMESWVRETLQHNKHSFPIQLNITDDRPNPVTVEHEDMQYFSGSYLSIVTETLFYQVVSNTNKMLIHTEYEPAYKFLTEKTFKPMVAKHPFILVAPSHTLQFLRDLGYKTFHPFINEMYDEMEDDNERMNCITQEILRLNSFSDEEWLKWQLDVQDVVEYNYHVLQNKQNFRGTPWNSSWFNIPR